MKWCDKCTNGVIMVGLDLYEKCKCQGERMAVNLTLDKCCAALNHEICCSRPKLESYTLSWNESCHSWQFDLKIRGYEVEPIKLCHRTMIEQGDNRVANAFRNVLAGVLR